MFDFFTRKFKGLNQVEEDANAFGMDIKQFREDEAKRRKNYKEQSLKAGRDLRFPSDWMKKKAKEARQRFRKNLKPLGKEIKK